MKNKYKLKKIVYTISLSAIALIVSLIEIPIPLAVGFKLDLSEVVVLVSYLILGFNGALTVIGFRSLTRRLFRGFDPMNLFGEGIAIVASLVILITYIIIKKIKKDQQKPLFIDTPIQINLIKPKDWIIIPIVLSLSLGIFLTIFHVALTPTILGLITTGKPLIQYNHFFDYLWQALIMVGSYIPLNFVKGVATGIIFLYLKPRLEQIEY